MLLVQELKAHVVVANDVAASQTTSSCICSASLRASAISATPRFIYQAGTGDHFSYASQAGQLPSPSGFAVALRELGPPRINPVHPLLAVERRLPPPRSHRSQQRRSPQRFGRSHLPLLPRIEIRDAASISSAAEQAASPSSRPQSLSFSAPQHYDFNRLLAPMEFWRTTANFQLQRAYLVPITHESVSLHSQPSYRNIACRALPMSAGHLR